MATIEEPPYTAGERSTLIAFLNWQRAAVIRKCDGMDDELAHRRPLAATSPLMSVAGLVSHLRWVERDWFEHDLLGAPSVGPWTDEDPDAEFKVDDVPLAGLLADYRGQCLRNDEIIAPLPLDTVAKRPRRGEPLSLRWILHHMIEETARHLGHLDILREQLDGRTGV